MVDSGLATAQLVPTLVVRGRVRNSSDDWVPGEVLVAGSTIIEVVTDGSARAIPANARIIDVAESFVLPGAVDAHVHSLSHPGEGIEASTRAAAAGGVTTIIEMPFDQNGPINTADRLKVKQDLVCAEAHVDVALLGTLAPDGGWRHADALVESGAVGFKVSLFNTDPERFPRISDRELLSVMAAVRDTGRTLCAHAENNEIITAILAEERRSGARDAQSHTRSRPPVSETLGVLTALEVAASTGARLHLCHLSLPRSVDLVSWYRDQGADVSLESCPHYLTFTAQDLDAQRGRLKINPPLRDAAAREGLWERLENGSIAVISSDHAPWSVELKDKDAILDNKSGAPGVQNLVSVTLGRALARDASLRLFGIAVDALSKNPARRYGIDSRKGSLEPGKDADIAIYSPDATHIISQSAMLSNAGWTPYEGVAPGGQITYTFSRGELIYSAGAGLVSSAGRGELVY